MWFYHCSVFEYTQMFFKNLEKCYKNTPIENEPVKNAVFYAKKGNWALVKFS
jgi:hypothetical protein